MSHRMTPRSRRHRNGADPFFEAFVAKLGLDPDLGEALGYRAKRELFAYIAKHIIPEGLDAVRLPDEAREFRGLSSNLVSPEGHDRLQNLITDTTTAISKAAGRGVDNDRYGARRAKAITEYYNPNRGFPQSFEGTHREFAYLELGDAEAAMDNALSALWYASSSDVFGLGATEGDLLAEAVISVIEVLTHAYEPYGGVAGEDVVMRTVSNALIWLQNIGTSDGRPLPKDLDRLEMPNKSRLADAQQRAGEKKHAALIARMAYGPSDARRVSNPRRPRR
jgi:hypothetical protein